MVVISGCLEGKLSPGEAQLCLTSTAVQPSVIPVCKSTQDCDEKLAEFLPAQQYQNAPVSIESIYARKGIAGTWNKIRQASETLDRIHASCATMQAANVLSLAVTSAGELQNALAASEEAQEYTYRALEKTIRSGAEMQLDKIKDTRAFEQYAALLQKAHDLETKNPSSEWGRTQLQNQIYFENISRIIGKNKAGEYGVEWNSIFDAYKTGVGVAAPKRARIITAVSPLWQGALSAFLGKSKSSNALGIVSEIHANEMIENMETVAAPQNGIIMQIWKEIAAFDQEISALVIEEEILEKKIEQKIGVIQTSEESGADEREAWIKLAPIIGGWTSVQGENVSTEANYRGITENISALAAQHAARRNEQITQTVPIGKRIEDWRKLEKQTEDILAKINENNQLIEKWKKACETIGGESETNRRPIEGAEDCQKRIDEQNSGETADNSAVKLAVANALKNCVNELNSFQVVLEEDISTEAQFNYYFDDGSLAACESALLNAQNRYAAIPIVNEYTEKMNRLKKVTKAVGSALHTLEWDTKSSADQKWKNAQKKINVEREAKYLQKELGKKISELDETILEMEFELDKIIQEAAIKINWKVVQPSVMQVNKTETLEWTGTIFPYWGEEIEQHFVASTTNPGIQTNANANNGTQVTLNSKEIILDGDTLPKEGIIVSGTGNGIGIQLEWDKMSAAAIGKTAHAVREGRLTTASTPAAAKWEWISPEGVRKESARVVVAEKPAHIEWKGNVLEVTADVSEKNTKIKQEYEVANAITVSTQMIEQINQWGRTYTTYRITVENRLENETIQAEVYTGITADAVIVESIFATNESGELVAHILRPDGSVTIPKQEVGPRRTRVYHAVVEMLEGAEEWASLVERLLLEIATIAQSEDTLVKNDAEKIKVQLWKLKSEKDTQIIAQKLISIQNEISLLRTRAEYEKNKWAEIENGWMSARESATQKESEWITKGNAALLNRNRAGVEEAIQKITEENTASKPPASQNSSEEYHKVNELKEKIAAAENSIQQYEKGINVGCEKLIQINFSCPLTEEMVRGFKKTVAADKKVVEKWGEKFAKLNEEQKQIEWKNIANEWEKKAAEISDIAEKVEESLRAIRNAAVERRNVLKKEAGGNTNEEIAGAVEKAVAAVENEEYGKGIFISQNMLNYLNGNKMTGMASIPVLAWPFLGIIMIVGGWLFWKEWKKKKIVNIPLQKIPKGNTIVKGMEESSSEREHLPMQAEHREEGIGIAEQYIQSRPQTLGRTAGASHHRRKNLNKQQ